MSWIQTLSKLIDGPYRDKLLGALGETFVRATESNPKFFALPGPMTGDVGALGLKHGLPLQQSTVDRASGAKDFVGVRDPEGGHSLYTTPIDRLGPFLERRGKTGWQQQQPEFKQLQDLYWDGKLGHDTSLYSIDSMGADAGTGLGKRGYGALYEYILAHPDAANLSDTLSSNNMKRRSVNMVGALEKWGDRAADRLIVNPDQLGLKAQPSRAIEYAGLPTIGKIGLLNGHVAANTAQEVENAAGLVGRPLIDHSYPGWSEKARSLGIQPGWEPSLDVPPEHWSDLADALRTVSPTAPGRDTLRRAAIVAEQLKRPGAKPLDLADRPDLTTGLARKRGGSV